MNKYSNEEIIYLDKLKLKIVKSHKKCEGLGYFEDVKPCTCMKIFKYIKALVYSRIPKDYWDLSLNELEIKQTYKTIIYEYIKNIDNAISQGLGLMLMSESRGIGKTSLICEIAKRAIIKRYKVFYTIMQNIVEDKYTDSQIILNRIKESDLIIIDEMDKVMMKENSNIPKQIENLLRDILPNKKSILLASNFKSEQELEEKFQIISLIKRYIKIVMMSGKDYSDIRQKQWTDKLKDKDINYFSKSVIDMAERFNTNEVIANEKEYNELF